MSDAAGNKASTLNHLSSLVLVLVQDVPWILVLVQGDLPSAHFYERCGWF